MTQISNRITALTWVKCYCGHAGCNLTHPINMGQFYQGSGFRPEERARIDEAFAALAEKEASTKKEDVQ